MILNSYAKIFFLSAMILLGNDKIHAKSSYCKENKLGWKFYCDDEQKQTTIMKDKIDNTQNNSFQSYRLELTNLQNELEEIKAKAVLYPTETNIKEYMVFQQRLLNQAGLFSDVWRRAVWKNPELDYTQQRPVTALGKEIWTENRLEQTANVLKNINERYGIFFVYSPTCPYCQKYSQILYNLKQVYNIEIRGISIGGGFLPLWERESFVNNGQLEQLGIDYSVVPVTVLYDNLSQQIVTVGYGLMTQDEVMERIYVLTQTKVGEDY
jgi:conjugal transfer pilus assembly protein TraF